jgi:DNA-binding NtrC family response regulator
MAGRMRDFAGVDAAIIEIGPRPYRTPPLAPFPQAHMPSSRSTAIELVRLLDGAAEPVYVTDDEGRIVFANQACADWTGWPASDLSGQVCRYHSSVEVTGVAAAAAALCPPPECFAGQATESHVCCPTLEGRLSRRRARFVPLNASAGQLRLIAAFVDPVDAPLEGPASAGKAQPAARLHERLQRYRHAQRRRYAMEQLLGDSPAMQRVRTQAALAAGRDASVLIIGPPGSGRAHVARAIHYGVDPSPHAPPLAPLSCSVMGSALLASSLEAIVESHRPRHPPGHGALLLTEVDQMPADVQAQLMGWIGAGTLPLRLLCTARRSLSAAVAREEFREDLACALSTIVIELPGLAERRGDVPLLAQRFLEEHNVRGTKQLRGWSAEALDRLVAHGWPGNLAELAEVAREAHAAAEGIEVTAADLPRRLKLAADAAARPRKQVENIVLEEFMAGIERELIERALHQARGNKTRAARLLGMTRPRLYRRLVQLGLEESRLPSDGSNA